MPGILDRYLLLRNSFIQWHWCRLAKVMIRYWGFKNISEHP